MNSMSLPASVEFLRRGGRFEDIDLADIRKFVKVMGDARSDFNCELLNIKKVSAGHIKALIETYSGDIDNAQFYKFSIN